MKSLLKLNKLVLTLILFAAVGCAKPQESHTQTITKIEGMQSAEINYQQGEASFVTANLVSSDIHYDRIGDSDVTITIGDAGGTTTFNEVPSKYINLDATVEISRNVFQNYFPEEWAAMKGQPYTTIYIKSKQDNQVFYVKCVFTNTDKEIGKYSEDF